MVWKFKIFRYKKYSSKYILKLVDFPNALPASKAVAERVFSIFNNILSSEFQMGLETVESLLIIKCSFEMECSEFKTFLSSRFNTLIFREIVEVNIHIYPHLCISLCILFVPNYVCT